MRKIVSETFFKYFLLLLPALVNLIVFLANFQANVLTDWSIKMYLSNFVHADVNHLLGNVIGYIVNVYLSFILFRKFGYEKVFWKSFTIIFILVPFLTSYFTDFLLNLPSIGFSGVVSAFIGLYAFTIVIFLTQHSVNSEVSFLFVFLIGVSVIPLTYGNFVVGSLLMIFNVFIALKCIIKAIQIEREELKLLIALFALYVILIVAIFPQQLFVGKSLTNILGHYVGFHTGYIIPWLLRRWR